MTTVKPPPTKGLAAPARSAASDIYDGSATQAGITAAKDAYTQAGGNSAGFWSNVDSALQSDGESSTQARDSIRLAQQSFDPGAYDVGEIADAVADGRSVSQAKLQQAVSSYTSATGGTAADFYQSLVADLSQVDGMSQQLAAEQARALQSGGSATSTPSA